MSEQLYKWFTQKWVLLVFHEWGPIIIIIIIFYIDLHI